jgi:VanZ family protein
VYRGLWMPLALIGIQNIAFNLHPRLKDAPQRIAFLWAFGLIAVGLWMLSVGPSPVRVLQQVADLLPLPLILIGLAVAVRFVSINRNAEGWPLANCLIFGVLGWIVVSMSGSQGAASPMIQFLMDRFGWDYERAESAVFILRKCIHFTGYGCIGLNAFALSGPRHGLNEAVKFGLAVAAGFAAFDEFRQTTSVGRTGSVWDVGLDLLGAITFIALGMLRYRQMNPNRDLLRNLD